MNILMSTSEIDAKWAYPILKKYICSEEKVLIFPFSFFDEVKNSQDWNRLYAPGGFEYREHVDCFKRYGIRENQIQWANYFIDSKEEMIRKIEESTLIFFTGGAPDLMMKRIKEFRLKKILKNYQGIILGYSAGAMIQLDTYHITPDEDYPSFGYYTGLGQLSGFLIEPHFSNRMNLEYIHLAQKEKKLPVYGIADDGGILVSDGKIECFGNVTLFQN